MRLLNAAAAIFALCTGAPVAAGLSADQIRATILDKTLDWSSGKNKSGTLVLKPDGTFKMTESADGMLSQDTGEWSMRGDKICFTWSLILRPNQRCFGVWDKSPGHYHTDNGLDWTIK